jgi:hypothetical protein
MRQVPKPKAGMAAPEGILQERINYFRGLQRKAYTLS